jgi:NADP-dependent 3-hydroxy acid dehydrogenase YdfG
VGKLDGQVAIVTGAGSGIGRATASMLAAEGASVVITGRRQAPLDALVAEIARAGGRVDARTADVGKPEEAAALARWTIERHGRVDILVNNAGSSSRVRNIRWVGLEEWERVFAVNVTGVYALTQAVLPDMITRGGGTIVTVSSAAALRPGLLGGAPYSAAKAAVRNLMGHVHAVLRDKGIRATTIVPAEVDTPILENRPLVPDARARATMMQPEDVAAAILLCVTLPPRTVVEEIVLSPTLARDLGADLAAARDLGGPPAAP